MRTCEIEVHDILCRLLVKSESKSRVDGDLQAREEGITGLSMSLKDVRVDAASPDQFFRIPTFDLAPCATRSTRVHGQDYL